MARRMELWANKDREILFLTEEDFSALNSLLYLLHSDPSVVTTLNERHGAGLGANQKESLTNMWAEIHGVVN